MTQPAADSIIWLTQEAHDRLSTELGYLKGPGRAEISRRIADAREEGDLRENGGYHAAREEQSQAEARITQLEDMLSRAQVGETPVNSNGGVEAGMEVTIRFTAFDDTETFLLGARENSVGLSVYSPQSPLGAAIVGKKAGDLVTYTAANGRSVEVEVVSAKPYTG